MTLLFVAPLTSIHSKRWIEYFAGLPDIDVHVATFSKPSVEIAGARIHTLEIPGRNQNLLSYYFKVYRPFSKEVKKLVRSIAPDVIHIHWFDFKHSFFCGLDGIPVIATAWGSDILAPPKGNLIHSFAVRKILKKADIITCDAEHLRDAMIKKGAPASKVSVIFFGTDLTIFNPERRDPNLAAELGFDPSSKLVISLRALRPIYNIETFVLAMPKILEKKPEARFVIVGDGEEREMLEQRAKELAVDSAVRFTGRLSDEDLQRYTASADVYVSTSLSDGGLAASTAEAMACSVPVVVSDFGNNRDWVEPGQTGLLFPLEDSSTLAEQVISLLDDPQKASEIGQNGMRTIDERNNYHREMEKVLQMYQRLSA